MNLLLSLSSQTIHDIAAQVQRERLPHDRIVASIHWGPNWGYEVAQEQRDFAHALIEEAAVDVVHGHSSHHPLGVEVHGDRLILYGAGDLLNDYEGIADEHASFRGDLSLLYFVMLDADSGRLRELRMTPMRMHGLRLGRATREDSRFLCEVLDRESQKLGARVRKDADERLSLDWQRSA